MSHLPPATLPAYLPPQPPPASEPTGHVFVGQLVGYLAVLLFDVGAWVGLADLVPAIGVLALVLLGLLLAPFVTLLLFEVGELVADGLGFVIGRLSRCGRHRLVLASV
jgi:hypothetical protein